MEVTVVIPLERFKVWSKNAKAIEREYEILRNGIITRADEKDVVHSL